MGCQSTQHQSLSIAKFNPLQVFFQNSAAVDGATKSAEASRSSADLDQSGKGIKLNRDDAMTYRSPLSIAEIYRDKAIAANLDCKQLQAANRLTPRQDVMAAETTLSPEAEAEVVIQMQKTQSLDNAANAYAGVISPSEAGQQSALASIAPSADDKNNISASEGWGLMANKIEAMDKEYIKVYENILERYTAMFGEFGELMGAITGYLDVQTDDKTGVQNFIFDEKALGAIKDLVAKFEGAAGTLVPVNGGSVTQAEAIKWAEQLGLDPSKCVQRSGNGYCVKMDISSLTDIVKNMPSSQAKLSTFEYQSWRSGYDAQGDRLKTAIQTLTTKYSSANGNFESLTKLLSSMINTMGDLLKALSNF